MGVMPLSYRLMTITSMSLSHGAVPSSHVLLLFDAMCVGVMAHCIETKVAYCT
jgi:hypothetical protein